MAFASVNGSPILEGTISLPRVGIWTAEVELPAPSDGAKTLTGRAAIALGSLSFIGTFAHTGLDGHGRLRAAIVGGGAGMGTLLAAKSYIGPTLRLPLQDVLTDAGEKLSPTSDPGVLAFQMPAWSRMQAVAGASLAALVNAAGATWRVLTDGSVWVGFETWPASTMTAVGISFESESKRRTVASLLPSVLPGQVYQGERVDFVQHLIASRSLRTMLHLE
jgi:hypothetical protein